MEKIPVKKFGRIDLNISTFSFGAAPIGNIFREISEETSQTMIEQAWENGIRYYDTAPMYGHGLSELRLGHALRWKNRDDFILSSKVGRVLKPAKRSSVNFEPWTNAAPFHMEFDYSYDGIMRSFEDSLQRLALERIDICFIHDIDRFTRGKEQPKVFKQAMDESWKALESLRSQGLLKAIGVGVNEWDVCYEALKQRDFDCFLLAGRYSLLEQESLTPFLDLCIERNVAVVVGGGFNSGILATGAIPGAKYNYSPAPEPILEKVRKIERVCENHGVPLPAAAIQFVIAHPAIASFIGGTRNEEQLQKNLLWFRQSIPPDFWSELQHEKLIHENAPVPSQ